MKSFLTTAALIIVAAVSARGQIPVSKNALVFYFQGFPKQDYVNIPHSSTLEPATITLEAWINCDAWYTRVGGNPASYDGIISKTESGGFEFEHSSFGDINYYAHAPSGYDEPTFSAVAPAYSGQWHHFAGTYDGSTAKLYIDGVLRSTDSKYSGGITYLYSNSLILGGEAGTGALSSGQFYGKLTDIRIWNYARNVDSILAGMHHGLAGNEAGLIGYWDFHEGSGTVLGDLTSNHNDGILTGSSGGTLPTWAPIAVTLPVELISFTATTGEKAVTLRWNTASEVNNFGFDVEKCCKFSTGGEQWQKIGFVEGHGSTNAPQAYSFVDNNTAGDAYRLKQIDRDGKFEYSNVVKVSAAAYRPTEFTLSQNFPNPFNPTTMISFTVPVSGRATLKIFNAIGQEVATVFNGEALGGINNQVQFNASNYSSGLYFSRLEYNGKTQLKKMTLIK